MSEEQISGEHADAAGPLQEAAAESREGEQREPQTVPLEAVQSERERRQRAEDEARVLRENLNLLLAQQRQRPEEQPQYSKDDVVTYGDLENILSKKEQTMRMSIEELRMTQRHPDYQEVVTKYLPEVLKTNPGLRNSLEQTQDYELAYHLAKNSEAYKAANKTVKRNSDAERIVQNSQRAGSLSSVGQTSPINEAKRYRDMSDQEFMKVAQKNLGYF